MNRILKGLLTAFALVAGAAMLPASALAYSGQQLAPKAKISMKRAEAIVKNAAPGGKITDRELEKEAGGSGLRYSFDVRKDGKTLEIGVDARTGRVLENAPEGPNPD